MLCAEGELPFPTLGTALVLEWAASLADSLLITALMLFFIRRANWYKNQEFLSLHRFDSSVLFPFLIRDTASHRYANLLKTLLHHPEHLVGRSVCFLFQRDPFLLEDLLNMLQDKSIPMYHVRSLYKDSINRLFKHLSFYKEIFKYL